ncbi:3665_t:CDS:2, partial [Paraglomus occultum]
EMYSTSKSPSSSCKTLPIRLDDSILDECIEQISQECFEEWHKLSELHRCIPQCKQDKELDKSYKEKSNSFIDYANGGGIVAKFKLEVFFPDAKETDIRSQVISEIMVKKRLYDNVQQYKQTLPRLREEVQEAKEQLKSSVLIREQKNLTENESINVVLRGKLDSLKRQYETPVEAENAELRKLRNQLKIAKDNMTTLMKELIVFVDKHFPPTILMQDDSDSENEGRVVTSSLKELLEDLMNQSFSNPDPYVQINSKQVWLPYVELLIRAGIAIQHPKDAYKIKLIEFHL